MRRMTFHLIHHHQLQSFGDHRIYATKPEKNKVDPRPVDVDDRASDTLGSRYSKSHGVVLCLKQLIYIIITVLS